MLSKRAYSDKRIFREKNRKVQFYFGVIAGKMQKRLLDKAKTRNIMMTGSEKVPAHKKNSPPKRAV